MKPQGNDLRPADVKPVDRFAKSLLGLSMPIYGSGLGTA